jgi:hypothetical protein
VDLTQGGYKVSEKKALDKIFEEQKTTKEDQKTEFKRSIFVDPETRGPGEKQMMTIAETLAAFMNADGGMLYVGVSDDIQIRGIESDLEILKEQSDSVVVHTERYNDETYAYGCGTDKYELKIRAIVKAYLSPNASSYLGSIIFGKERCKTICRIEAKKCKPDDFVYYYRRRDDGLEIAEIPKRFGNLKRKLRGVERDEFVRNRTREHVLANVNAVISKNPSEIVNQVVAAINNAFAAQPQVVGAAVQVEGAVSLNDKHFASIKSPRGLVFDGVHVCDVKSWKEAYGALLVKLNSIDASKFDGIASEDFFNKWFVEVQPRRRYTDCFKDKLSASENIRGLVKVSKVHFINPDYIVHKLLARFGIEPGRVALRG